MALHSYHTLPEQYAPAVLIVLPTDDGIIMTAAGIVAAAQLLMVGLCSTIAVLIFRNLRERSEHFSQRTYVMHRQLSVLLVMQVLVPAFFIALPLGIVIMDLFSPSINVNDAFYGNLAFTLISLYGTSNSLMTIFFVAPYRRYTHELVGRAVEAVFCLKEGRGCLPKNYGGGGELTVNTVVNKPAIQASTLQRTISFPGRLRPIPIESRHLPSGLALSQLEEQPVRAPSAGH